MPIDRTRSSARRAKPLAISVAVPMDDQGYSVLVGPGLRERIAKQMLRSLPSARRVAVVSDSNVMPLYGPALVQALQAEGLTVESFEVPAGEASKSVTQLVELVEGFAAAGLGRKDAVVALGGGVVGDLAGFAAASFMRGIAFIQVPTSLLAQVDASVGGKVAVDLPCGKNMMGAFYFPTAVFIDPAVLATLDARQIGCGLAEMVKHAALFSPEQFESLIEHADDFYDGNHEVIARSVAASVALKAACVSRDPHEHREAAKGRVVLNLGHTLGHAIESSSEFETMHGEAVALGMVAAARLSERRGLAQPGLESQMVSALERLRLPTDLDAWLTEDRVEGVAAALEMDKKRSHGTLSYIALCRIGEPTVLQLSGQDVLALIR